MTARPLRPHQVRAMDLLKSSIRSGKRRPILQAPTGFGKTRVGAEIVTGAHAKGNRVTFCVPALSLIDQTFDAFVNDGVDPGDIGVIQADHPWRRPHAPIQIASAQTLARRTLPLTDVVVVDECHVRFAVYEKWMNDEAMARKLFIGLSATPWAKGLGLLYDDLLKPTSTRELIEQGYLSKFRVFAPGHVDLTGVKTIAGDYHEGQLAEAMGKPKLVADIVANWLEKGPGEKTLCFAVNRVHAQMIHDQFAESGVAVAYIDAYTPREEREAIGRRLAAGEIKVVCNIGTLTTGIDWDVRCIILARPTKSESLFVQIIGRGLRTAEGKEYLTIFDHSDTHTRLGMVDEIDHAKLSCAKAGKGEGDEDEDERGDEIKLPEPCAACGCLVPPASRECPACGFRRKPKCDVETQAGELQELGRGGKFKKGKNGKEGGVRLALVEMGKSEVWGQIQHVAAVRGWSDGRAAHAFRDIFGVWPNAVRHEAHREPSMQLLAWLRARAIAFAKAKQSEAAE